MKDKKTFIMGANTMDIGKGLVTMWGPSFTTSKLGGDDYNHSSSEIEFVDIDAWETDIELGVIW